MSNLSTFRIPVLTGNAATYGSAITTPVLTLDGKGHAVLSTAPLFTHTSDFINDANFVSGTATSSNVSDTIVQRDSLGRFNVSSLYILGTPGATNAASGANAGIELGRTDIATTPFIDFHSSGNPNDYDARLIATGGNALGGLGSLSFYGASINFNSQVYAGALQTSATNINLILSETGHATSKRASMRIGSGWEIGQDPNVNGTKDFYLYNSGIGQHVLNANAATNNVTLSNSVTVAGSVSAAGTSVGLIRTSTKGAIQMVAGNSVNSGYLEFYPPGTGQRHGYIGFGDGSSINISGEVGYFNFIGNAPRISGQPIVARNADTGINAGSNLVLSSGTSVAVVYTDTNTNNIVLRTGPSTAYRYSYFDNSGGFTTGAGFFTSDLHTHRGDKTGYAFFGNENTAFFGYDAFNIIIKGNGTSSLIYRNTTTANYKVFDQGNINPIVDNRLAYAGDATSAAIYTNGGGGMYEPYAGGVVTGFTANSAGNLVTARWRYMQKQDSYGNWYTVAYA